MRLPRKAAAALYAAIISMHLQTCMLTASACLSMTKARWQLMSVSASFAIRCKFPMLDRCIAAGDYAIMLRRSVLTRTAPANVEAVIAHAP